MGAAGRGSLRGEGAGESDGTLFTRALCVGGTAATDADAAHRVVGVGSHLASLRKLRSNSGLSRFAGRGLTHAQAAVPALDQHRISLGVQAYEARLPAPSTGSGRLV